MASFEETGDWVSNIDKDEFAILIGVRYEDVQPGGNTKVLMQFDPSWGPGKILEILGHVMKMAGAQFGIGLEVLVAPPTPPTPAELGDNPIFGPRRSIEG